MSNENLNEEVFMFEELGHDVYILIDENNVVRRVEADWNCPKTDEWILVESNVMGDFGMHAQSSYLPYKTGQPLFDEEGRFNHVYRDGALVLLTDEEKEELFPTQPTPVSFEEEQLDFNLDIDYRVTCLELGVTAE